MELNLSSHLFFAIYIKKLLGNNLLKKNFYCRNLIKRNIKLHTVEQNTFNKILFDFIFSLSAKYMSIRAGSDSKVEGGQIIQVEEIIQHPKYNGLIKDYDISILKVLVFKIRSYHFSRSNKEQRIKIINNLKYSWHNHYNLATK